MESGKWGGSRFEEDGLYNIIYMISREESEEWYSSKY